MEEYKEIERSLITKYRKDIWSKFVRAVQDYKLINENDKVMVCISGGKDSFLLAKCIQELERHGKVKFEAKYVVMNPGYAEKNRELIYENAKRLNIPITMFDSDIFDVVNTISGEKPCYLCARMRRGFLYSKAKELGCNKIALGHHFDDVIETTLLSMFYGSEVKTMMPKLHSDNYEGLELIRPLYLVKEDAIISWKNYNKLVFLNCACKFTERIELSDKNDSKRKEMKELIKELRKLNKSIDYNIFKALDNVNLNCVLGTKKNGEYHSFLDDYDNKQEEYMNFYELAKSRYSTRSFSDRKVSDEDIEKIVECGRISPTAKNLQPEVVYVIKSEEGMSKLKNVCKMTYNAPVCLMVCADTNISWKNELESGYDSYEMDTSIVATHMILEATDLGINSVWVRMFNSKEVTKEFNLPSNIVPVCLLMIGYTKEGFGPSKLHNNRKELNEMVRYL